MHIFLLSRDDYADYDEQNAVVIIAENEDTARSIASKNHGDEGSDRWLTNRVTVTILGDALNSFDAGVYCRDFHAG